MRVFLVLLTAVVAALALCVAVAVRQGRAPASLPTAGPIPREVGAERPLHESATTKPETLVAAKPEAARTISVAVPKSEAQTMSDQIDELVGAGKIGQARGQAEVFLTRFPNDPEAVRIESLTGVHPRPGLFGRRTGAPNAAGESK
jgi:hypothetical protein